MKNRRIKAGISFLIAVIMLFSFRAPCELTAADSMQVNEAKVGFDAMENSAESSLIDQCSILNYVDEKEFIANGFTKRVYGEEDLNTYIFEREDGTRGLYMFAEDVKFEDAAGTVIEKDISLEKTAGGYSTKQNDVGLFIPDNLSNGVELSFNEKKLIISAPENYSIESETSDNSVKFTNAYGDNAHLVFTPTLSGVKQDIVLDDYVGINSFDIIISSESLKPFYNEGGTLYFAETELDECRFNIGSAFVYDSSVRFTCGDIMIDQISEDEWKMSLIVPEEFLSADSTVYPVTIDPKIDIKSGDNPAYIEDTTVYSGKPTLATGTWIFNHTGFLSDGYNKGRMLIRTPGLYNNSTFNSIQASQIFSAKFCIKETSGTPAQEVKLYAYTGISWSENTATWNNTSPDGSYPLIDTQYPVNGGTAEYNVTNLVKGWKNGTYTASLGFMLKSTDESNMNNAKAFDASESPYTDVQPYIIVNYRPQIFLFSYAVAVNEGETFANLAITNPITAVQWTSSNTSVATVSSTGVITGVKASAMPVAITATALDPVCPVSATCIVYVKIPDGTYYIKNKGSGRYIDATGYSTGDEVLRWHFHGASNQRWDIEYISNGLYSIKNKMSNLYLGVEALNSTTAITRQYSTLNNSTKWYIAKTTSGAYCFYASGNSAIGYVIGADPNSNNTIVNMAYTNNADYKDEWVLTRFNNVSIRKLTDETYREEYPSYQSNINNYLSIISSPFERSWAILFEDGSWYSDSSLPAADCPLANNQRCHDHQGTCGTACSNDASTPNHHKNHYRNWYLVRELGKGETDITIGFFGFNPCSAGGLSLDWLSTVCQPTNTTFSEQYNRRALQHEISHLFGCHDGECTAGQNCIMSGGFDNCANFDQIDIWCSNCHESFDRLAH